MLCQTAATFESSVLCLLRFSFRSSVSRGPLVELARASSSQHRAANSSRQVALGAAAAAAAAGLAAQRAQLAGVDWEDSQICLAGTRGQQQQVVHQPRLGLEALGALEVQVGRLQLLPAMVSSILLCL
jgi:hypothetical protein